MKCFIEARPGVDHKKTRARTSLCPVQTNVLLRQCNYRCSVSQVWAEKINKKNETQNKKWTGLHKCNWKTSSMYYIVLIQTHELGDSYDKRATPRDRLLIIDWRWTTAATAKEDHAASHSYRQQQQHSYDRYGDSSSPRWCCWVECILTVRYNWGYSNGASEKAKKKRHTSKKNDKGAKKSNTPVTV